MGADVYKLAHIFPTLKLPTPNPSHLQVFQTSQRTLSDRFTSPSHLNISSVYVPLLPPNALIKVTESFLTIKSKEKILSFSYWNSLLHLTMLITFCLERFTTMVALATLLLVVCRTSEVLLSLSFVTCSHLDWFLTCHCNSGFCPGPCPILSLVASLILGVPITLRMAMALGQCFRSNLFLSPRPWIQVPAGLQLAVTLTVGCI